MLIGLIGDPHSNLQALRAVLADVDRMSPDALLCLGDFVGYGAQPDEVVELLAGRCDVALAGNHDILAIEGDDEILERLNPVAALATVWTRRNLSPDSAKFLRALEPSGRFEDLEIRHASLRDPVWEYIDEPAIAAANFNEEEFGVAAVGHTHVPAAYWEDDSGTPGGGRVAPGGAVRACSITLEASRVILNPGGVGQPRDGDPRASWGTWDTEKRVFSVRRVLYPIEEAQKEIISAGLPQALATRLATGT